jgi:transposase
MDDWASHECSPSLLIGSKTQGWRVELSFMPGVGPLLACTLIALLPELGRMTRKQVAALVGVAPYAFESGSKIWRH